MSSAATSTAVTAQTLIGACGAIASAAAVGRAIVQSARFKQIEVFSPPAAQGSNVTCSILFAGGDTTMPREVSDTSVSVTTPAHIIARPLPNTVSSFWHDSSVNVTLFNLVAPAGSIIDVWVDIVLADGVSASPVATVLVGATVGGMYYSGLDNLTKANAVYLPVSLVSL